MTLIQSDVLDAILAGGDIDIIRRGIELVLQALIKAEATETSGATRDERSETRTNQRNGSGGRLLTTKVGDVELNIPKPRRGSFFPTFGAASAASTGPCSPADGGLRARPVRPQVDLVAALGAGTGI